MENNSRRTFLGACLGCMGLAFTGAAAYPLIQYLAPARKSDAGKKAEIPESEIAEGSARFLEINGKTAVVVRKKGGALVAFSAVCTHLGCVIQWRKESEDFLCPCHAGRFSTEGAVLAGPPPKPLERLPLVVANGVITVG